MSRPYRKRGEPGMEEENALRFQPTELSVTYLVDQPPMPIRLEAAHLPAPETIASHFA